MHSGTPLVGRIPKGYIQRVDTFSNRPTGDKFNFLFNPNEFQVQYSKDINNLAPDLQNPGGAGTNAGGPSAISFGFQLLIDRVFEVSFKEVPGSASRTGVLHDVACIEALLGVTTDAPYLTESIQMFVMGPALVFYGTVNTMSIQYAFFSKDMIPMRCVIDLGIMVKPSSTFRSTAAAAASAKARSARPTKKQHSALKAKASKRYSTTKTVTRKGVN